MRHLHRRALALVGALALCALTAVRAEDANDAFRRAEDLYKARKYAEAIPEFKGFVAQFPTEERASLAAYRVAQCYGKQEKDQWAAAAEAFGLCARQYPDTRYADVARYNQAYYFLKAEQWQPAAEAFFTYTKLGKTDGLKAQAWYWRGEALYKLKRPEDALKAYDAMLAQPAAVIALEEVQALVPYARFGAAYCLYDLGRYDKAVEAFHRLLDPGVETAVSDQALYYLGDSLWRLKRPAEAVKELTKVAERYEKSEYAPEALARIVAIEAERGNAAAARKAGDLLKARYPDYKSTDKDLRLADAELRAGNPAGAETLALELLKTAGGRTEAAALMLLGEARVAQGKAKLADAEAAYVLLLQKQPTDALAPRATARLAEVRLRRAEQALLDKQPAEAKAQGATAEKACRDYLAAWPAGDDAAVVRFNLALSLHYQERTNEAVAGFQQVVAANPAAPESAAVLLEMGRLALKVKRFADARWAYETYLKHHAKTEDDKVNADWGLVQVAKGEGDPAATLKQLRKFVDAHPKHEWSRVALVEMIDQYRLAGQEERAQELGRELRKKFPGSREAAATLLNAGYDHYNNKRYDRAIIALEAYVRDFADDRENMPAALSNLGASYYSATEPADHFQRAADTYARLAKEFPDTDGAKDALYWAGSALAAAGKQKEAAAAYQGFFTAHPEHPKALRARLTCAKCLSADKRSAEAATVLRDAVKLAAGDPALRGELLYELGWALKEAGQTAESWKAFEELVRTDRSSSFAADASFRLIGKLLDEKRWKEAADGYEEWLDKHADHALGSSARYNQAFALEQSGDFKTAAAGYTKALFALKEDGPRQQAAFRAAYCLFRANNAPAALAAFDAFERDFPKSTLRPESLFYRGQVLSLQGRWTDAEKAFRLLVKDYPKHDLTSSGQYNLAVSLQNQSRYLPAVDAYDAVIAASKDQPLRRDLLAQASLRRGECLWVLLKYDDALLSLATAEQSGVRDFAAPAAYWIARCYQAKMDSAKARAKYLEVRDKYADTEWAKQASEALKSVGG